MSRTYPDLCGELATNFGQETDIQMTLEPRWLRSTVENSEADLDGLLEFMQRKDMSSNPALKEDSAIRLSRAVPVSSSTLKVPNRRESGASRDDRGSNLHVIEEIYYNCVGKSLMVKER
ncbi:hypothetical protein PoB_001655500 [Plakobranchus ocellatus]|uniref:Uncharacterized protein n=1 Tax=Plakobranchus ocellatus TaxID=259542 RepID=A0AAV3Z3P5_9GAST|nr:hypothetical protein PoB_001655500 [Plakobranchus ocellatus]